MSTAFNPNQCLLLGEVRATRSSQGLPTVEIHSCPIYGSCLVNHEHHQRVGGKMQLCGSGVCDRYVTWPTVSVVITCHNYGRFLSEAIKSVEEQTVKASSILVVDDASTDDSSNIFSTYAAEESTVLSYLWVEYKNVYLARKAGLNATSGEFVIFLDGDDELEPTYIQECLTVFDRNPGLGICTTLLQMFGRENDLLRMTIVDINQGNWIAAASMVRRSVLIECDAFGLDELDNHIAEDWYVWRKVMNAGFDTIRIEKPLIHYRRHDVGRWDNVLVSQPYYTLAGLALETVSFAERGSLNGVGSGGDKEWGSEYVAVCDGRMPSNEEIQSLLRKFWRNVAGVTGDGFSIVRRSVVRQIPTDDPLSDEWKATVVRFGYQWIPEFTPPLRTSSPAPLQAVLVTPLLTIGGAEQWCKMLVTLSDPEKIHWRVALTDGNLAHPSIVGPICKVADLYAGGKGYADGREAVKAACEGADIVLAWGGNLPWPFPTSLPIVAVSHQCIHIQEDLIKDAQAGGAKYFTAVSELSKILTTTPEMKATVIWNGADAERLKVNAARRDVQTQWGVQHDYWSGENIYCGYLGRMAHEKNVISTIRAVAQLPWQFKCVLIGDGPISSEIDAQGKWILDNRFYHIPAVNDVGNHFNAMDVLVQVSDFEGNSISIIEAMLVGVPIVTTRVGAVAEFEKAAGRELFWSVAEMPTTHEIAVAIRDATKAGKDDSRVKAAKEFALKNLTGDAMADKWTEYLMGIAGQKRTDEAYRTNKEHVRPIVPVSSNGRTRKRFAYFTGTNRPNEKPIIDTMIRSARAVGVQEDFCVFAPMKISDAINHPIASTRSWQKHMAKIEFLLELKNLDYEYFVWLDTDNYFVRHPGDFRELIRNEPVWVSMESDLTSPDAKFHEWYGLYLKGHSPSIFDLYKQFGAHGPKFWNTNGGMFIVRHEAIQEFHDKCFDIFHNLHQMGYSSTPDEPPIAIAADAMVSDPNLNTLDKHTHLWACDWHSTWSSRLPDGNPWMGRDWLTQTDIGLINPAIVHAMRSKHLMSGSSPAIPPTTRILPCIHRGQVIRADVGNLCGSKGKQIEIYSCALHTECSTGRYCQHQTVRTCVTCGDRKQPSAADYQADAKREFTGVN